MNLPLGRNPHPLFQVGTTPSSAPELIPIKDALDKDFVRLIQARLRNMNRTNNSSSLASSYSDFVRSNELSQEPMEFESQPEMPGMLGQQTATICFTLIGNLLMIFVILRNNFVLRRKRITPVQMLMLNLCTSDLLFGVLTILPNIFMTITSPYFHGPDILCKMVKFLQVLPMYSSSFLLVAISADRFHAICRPLANIRSGRYNRPVLYATIAWITAFIFSTPQFVIFGKRGSDCMGLYTENWQYAAYVIVFNVVAWLLPSIIAGSLYLCVCKAVWKSMAFEKNCVTPTRGSGSFSTKTKARNSPSYNNNENENQTLNTTLTAERRESRMCSFNTLVHSGGLRIMREELDRKRIQTVKLTLTIVLTNFVLWAPFCLINVIDALMPHLLNPVFATYIMFFGNLNSSVNPLIWITFNWDMVKAALSPIFNDDRKEAVASTRPSDCSQISHRITAVASVPPSAKPLSTNQHYSIRTNPSLPIYSTITSDRTRILSKRPGSLIQRENLLSPSTTTTDFSLTDQLLTPQSNPL